MCDKHWTDDQLVSKLFDVGPHDGHLKTCPECTRRWEAMQQRHNNLRAGHVEVSEEELLAQRRSILAQLQGNKRRFRPILVPSLAAVILLALVVLVLFKPDFPEQQTPHAVVQDTMIEEIYQLSFSPEPAAIAPVQALFEEQP